MIADGLLARCSVVDTEPAAAFPILDQFIAGLVAATTPANRPILIGSARARAMGLASA